MFGDNLSYLRSQVDAALAIEAAAKMGLNDVPHHIALERLRQARLILQAARQDIHPYQYEAQQQIEAEERKKNKDMEQMLTRFDQDEVNDIGVEFIKDGITRALDYSVEITNPNFVKIATKLAKVIKKYDLKQIKNEDYVDKLKKILATKGGKKRYKKSKKYLKKSRKYKKSRMGRFPHKKSRNKRR